MYICAVYCSKSGLLRKYTQGSWVNPAEIDCDTQAEPLYLNWIMPA